MKAVLLLIGLCAAQITAAQAGDSSAAEEKVFEQFDVPQKAEFKGGERALMLYLAHNTKYPELALEEGVEGVVMVQFTVTKDGQVTNVRVVSEELGFGLEQEAIRVIKSTSGMWKPAELKGKAVNMFFRQPLSFKLN